MKLRKINAVFSLLSTILLLNHAIFLGIWMLSRGSIHKAPSFVPRALVAVVVVHAAICMAQMHLAHKGLPKNQDKSYPRLNVATMFQRISGVLMILFIALHILGAGGVMHTPRPVHAVVPPLFFLLVLAHIAVSGSKALITLGIGNARFVKCADLVIKGICAATLLIDLIGFYLFAY